MTEVIQDIFNASFRVNASKICDYVLRGDGRGKVPLDIHMAVWELQYALNQAAQAAERGEG